MRSIRHGRSHFTLVKKFVAENPHVGAQFNKKVKPVEMDFVSDILDEECADVDSSELQKRSMVF